MRTWAKGLYCVEAAVELLIAHGSWLCRDDFLTAAIEIDPGCGQDRPLASVDWEAAAAGLDKGDLACSSSEARILQLASSLAAGIPVDLREVLSGLDKRNAALVVGAALHATGCDDQFEATGTDRRWR